MKHLILTLLVSIPAIIFSQGTISGVVSDQRTADPLIGCNVLVKELGSGASTDIDGSYQINVPEGTYTLVVSYLGFQDKTVEEVLVKNKEVTYLDIALSDEALDLDLNVVVKATTIKTSENSILLLQKKSDKIQDGISSQEMSRLAVSDAAGAMKKVTGTTVSGGKYIYIRGLGDRYSLSQLNGLIIPSADPYRNGAQLDLIPANLLDNIITSKTFTPDQPGTFTGGNVDIKTKSFPEQFSLTLSSSVGYNPNFNLTDRFLTHPGGKYDYLGYDDGGRARPDLLTDPEVLSVLNKNTTILGRVGREPFPGAFQEADAAVRSLNNQYEPQTTRSPLDHSLGLSFGNQIKLFGNPLGIILSASYKRSFEHLDRFQKANWRLENISTGTLRNQGDFEDTKSTDNPIVNGLFGLAYKFGGNHAITFNTIYNHNTEKITRYVYGEQPDNIVNPIFLQGRALIFNQRELINYQLSGDHVFPKLNDLKIEWKTSLAESTLDEPDSRFFNNAYNIETDLYYIPESDVERPFHFFRHLNDVQKDAKLDITIPLDAKKNYKLQVGGLYSTKDRDFYEDRFQIDQFQGTGYHGDPDVYLSEDNIGIISSEGNKAIFGNYLVNRTTADNIYSGYQNVTAGYGMITATLTSRMRFVGGVRAEKTDMFVESAAASRADSLRIGKINDLDFLPSLSLIYSLNENMNIRATFAQTIARPNLREIAPFVAFDPLTNEFYLGNTRLKKSNIDNYDLRWEWFMKPGELLAFSAYYKEFTNPISLMYRRSSNPEIQFTNVAGGNLFGLEFELRKDFGFISPSLEKFKLNTNFSWIQSKLDVIDLTGLEPENRPFEGQSPFIVNAGLLYIDPDHGIDASLALNVLGDRLNIIGREGTPDIYDRGRAQLDFSLAKTINQLTARISVRNILDNPYVISSEYLGNEFIYSKYKQGISYSLGLSYTIR
ncbi:MAG TPA: TonB-dependent receptor [Saprospiraceae bacterium]|nr:TonB-dependent receptor [Saprospiraceae bacterium]MCB9269395.1 TonB-dependent receptor [Lewinellaceae bacterium]HPG06983.1 TonB-dependent receptor [Saprospiraceae bacterium]HPQ98481.1 TonB-dependent receptor [Saprospiraceae bacterium]HRV85328.1 TonB-dependent receptor [Saprospiraceae bacterium]